MTTKLPRFTKPLLPEQRPCQSVPDLHPAAAIPACADLTSPLSGMFQGLMALTTNAHRVSNNHHINETTEVQCFCLPDTCGGLTLNTSLQLEKTKHDDNPCFWHSSNNLWKGKHVYKMAGKRQSFSQHRAHTSIFAHTIQSSRLPKSCICDGSHGQSTPETNKQ